MTPEEIKKLQKMILDHMDLHGFTQVDMAAELNISQSTLSAWLNGEHGITKKMINRILHVCRDVSAGRDIISVSDSNGVHINTIDCSGKIEEYKKELLDAVMENSDLTADAKIIVYKLIKETKGKTEK